MGDISCRFWGMFRLPSFPPGWLGSFRDEHHQHHQYDDGMTAGDLTHLIINRFSAESTTEETVDGSQAVSVDFVAMRIGRKFPPPVLAIFRDWPDFSRRLSELQLHLSDRVLRHFAVLEFTRNPPERPLSREPVVITFDGTPSISAKRFSSRTARRVSPEGR